MVTIRRSDFWIEVEMRTDILFPAAAHALPTTRSTSSNASGACLRPSRTPFGWKDIPTTSRSRRPCSIQTGSSRQPVQEASFGFCRPMASLPTGSP